MNVTLAEEIGYSLRQIDQRIMEATKGKLLVNKIGRVVERIHPWAPSDKPPRYWYGGGWQSVPEGRNLRVNKPSGKAKK